MRRTRKASAGPEVSCPPSNPQDLRVKYGEGGPLAQVNWMHNPWITADSTPPVLVPRSRPPKEAVRSGYQEAPKKTKHQPERWGRALSETFIKEKFNSLNARVQSTAEGAKAGKFELTAGKFDGDAKDIGEYAKKCNIGFDLGKGEAGTI